MIDGIFASQNYQATQALLDVTAARHKVMAGNLANADTPGYKRLDIDASFEKALTSQIANGQVGTLNPSDIIVSPEAGLEPISLDGNNVSTDRELMLINENALRYEMLGQFVSSSLRQLRVAITGRNQ
ncbi:MAG: flagellar basal body rod protein FlgB [Verrucomicrobiae bacterium]|nr:flagellar basal body rod protein FlgB [Verrucomicrobiae bacterium]